MIKLKFSLTNELLFKAINDLENYESSSDKDRPKIIKSLYTKQSSRFKQKSRKSLRRIDQIDIEGILYSSTFSENKEESKTAKEISVSSYEPEHELKEVSNQKLDLKASL